MNTRLAVLIGSLAALPFAAGAHPLNGLYVGAGVGLNIMQDQSVSSLPGTPARGRLEHQLGPATVISLGWGFGNGLRLEAEGSYRYNDVGGASGFGPHSTGRGTEQKFGLMANALYDFVGVLPNPDITPYLGVGLGYQWALEQGVSGAASGGAFRIANEANTGAFAYQAIAGASYPVAAVPGLAVTGEYRFMGLAEDRTYHATTTSIAGPAIGNARLGSNYNHSLLIGLRYSFGQAPPPPPPMAAAAPAPAVQPVRTYLVFFDWDSAALNTRARQIIADAAMNASHVQTTRIEVNGYTDTSGNRQYNQRLSVRRADAVAAELVRHGVARTAIRITGYGQTHLLVPTADGVREPQNRRVEILLK